MWPWNANTPGTLYIVHFDRPLGNLTNPRAQARHYCGFCEDLAERFAKHHAGNGSRIMAAAIRSGIGYTVHHWPACLAVEKLVKRAHDTAAFCPDCAAAAGRRPRPLPVPFTQLTLDLDDPLPEIAIGQADWYEIATQQRWRAARSGLVVSGGIDDDLL